MQEADDSTLSVLLVIRSSFANSRVQQPLQQHIAPKQDHNIMLDVVLSPVCNLACQ